MNKNDGVSTDKNASDCAGISMSCKARFSFHSPHKILQLEKGEKRQARVRLGLVLLISCRTRAGLGPERLRPGPG